MPTTLNNGIQLPDKGSVDWYSSMQSNYNLIDTHLGNTDIHVTAEDKANWDSKQGSLSQAQLDAIAQVATNTSDIATLQSGKANASHTHSSSDITDIDDYATKDYVDNSISGLVDNAPDALNTLNELSAALNDDSNFASTVTSALADKANSADLATVATSGDYDDLSNKPSIPINTSDLNNDSGFVTLNDFDIPAKTSDLTNDSGFITSSDVPISTSDLINDSNFVDTSNAAVASGITSAKVTDYDTHIADTDIHVTTADKATWNTVTSKANDSDVVHKSGDETVAGFKEFANIRVTNSIKAINLENTTTDLNNCYSDFAFSGESRSGNIQYYYCNTLSGAANISNLPEVNAFFLTSITTRLTSKALYVKQILISSNKTFVRYCNSFTWGSWVNETDSEYVHKSGDETVGGQKTFSHVQIGVGRDLYHFTPNPYSKNTPPENRSFQYIWFIGNSASQGLTNHWYGGYIEHRVYPDGSAHGRWFVRDTSESGLGIELFVNGNDKQFRPQGNNIIDLGTPANKWKSFNGLEPSSLSLPSGNVSDVIDISSYLVNLDGRENTYTAPANGWISIAISGTAISIISSPWSDSRLRPSNGPVRMLYPIIEGMTANISVVCTTLAYAFFIPCQGNV